MGQYKLKTRTYLNKTRKRRTLAKLIIKILEATQNQKEIDIEELRTKLRIPPQITNKQLTKIIQRLRPNTKIIHKYYHWYDEPPDVKIEIKSKILKKLLDDLAKKHKAKNYKDLLQRKFKIPTEKIGMIQRWLKKPYPQPKVKSLLYLCKKLKINPKQLEEKGLFTRKFPINLKTPTLIKLKTHILNEGKITITKTTKQLQANYVNKDPTLHKYVIELLKELEANVKEKPRWEPSRKIYVTNIDPTIARALIKTGLKPGKKTITNPTLDPEIYKNPELRKYHFKATLTEEGTSSLHITKEKRLRMSISWSRSIDITDKLTPQQIQKIKQLITEKKRKIPIGEIKGKRYFDILNVIVDNPPKLLVDEMKILNKVHSKTFKIRPQKIHVSKDEHISVAWDIIFFDIKSLSLFYFEYGMLDNTWKSMRLKKQFELFRKYGRKKLSEEEINEIQEYLNQIPRRITSNWIKSAAKKLFRET